MVSTHSQYITDYHAPSSSDGKSPLAMLAKTCETIGLPDCATAKKSPTNGDKRSDANGTDANPKKELSPSEKRREQRSPRTTPTSTKSDPITSTSSFGMAKPGQFPMGYPQFPFYPGMMPFSMPFPSFPMSPFMAPRAPCPSAMMRQPCVTPGCTTCPTSNANDSLVTSMAQSMAQQFNPLYAAYAAMMPTTSASPMTSYQSLLASAAAASAASAASSVPKPQHQCAWMESGVLCGKSFSTTDELASHMKAVHAPSPPSSSATPDKTPSRVSMTPRFHPYGKPSPMPSLPSMPSMPMNFNPMALHAMYAQRMMMPHP